jgi:hypothetical protein
MDRSVYEFACQVNVEAMESTMGIFNRITELDGHCRNGLQLRRKVQKLRWMRLDREADQVVREIEELDCGLPKAIAPIMPSTD